MTTEGTEHHGAIEPQRRKKRKGLNFAGAILTVFILSPVIARSPARAGQTRAMRQCHVRLLTMDDIYHACEQFSNELLVNKSGRGRSHFSSTKEHKVRQPQTITDSLHHGDSENAEKNQKYSSTKDHKAPRRIFRPRMRSSILGYLIRVNPRASVVPIGFSSVAAARAVLTVLVDYVRIGRGLKLE
jgi:hypothetical protein